MTPTQIWSGGDGSHWGLSDWYPKLEQALATALKTPGDWTTGWYGSKKEIASARITRTAGKVRVEVSVSDDFDTTGHGETTRRTRSRDALRQMIDTAWDAALADKRENECYIGYSIGLRSGAQHRGTKRIDWRYTYLVDRTGDYIDGPPGDEYGQWGWQDDDMGLTDAERTALETGMAKQEPRIVAGRYIAEQWDNEGNTGS